MSLYHQIIKNARSFEAETGKPPTRLHITGLAVEKLKMELRLGPQIERCDKFYGMNVIIEENVYGNFFYLTRK